MRNGAGPHRHLVAVVAFDGVVLGDVSTPCEIFGRARRRDGRRGSILQHGRPW